MGIGNILRNAQKFALDNSPAILTAIGVTGTVTTAVLASKASFKAAEVINDNTREVYRDATAFEKIKMVWPLYIPAAGVAVGTVTCIVAANRIGSRRAAAMAAAFSLSEKAFEEYREKVTERLGAKKEDAIRDEIAQDRVRANPVKDNEIIITGDGDVLCFDEYTQRYFTSNMQKIQKAENDVNYEILNHGYASLNRFYQEIGLSSTKFGDDVGWSSMEKLDVKYRAVLSENDRPCMVIDFRVEPVRDFFRTH